MKGRVHSREWAYIDSRDSSDKSGLSVRHMTNRTNVDRSLSGDDGRSQRCNGFQVNLLEILLRELGLSGNARSLLLDNLLFQLSLLLSL